MASLKKAEALALWRSLPEGQPLDPEVIPYKHTGTTYGADGVRIEGRREFVEAVLSRLKPLLAHENGRTRLGLSLAQVEPREGHDNDFIGNWTCYVKVHQRGRVAQIMNALGDAAEARIAAREGREPRPADY